MSSKGQRSCRVDDVFSPCVSSCAPLVASWPKIGDGGTEKSHPCKLG